MKEVSLDHSQPVVGWEYSPENVIRLNECLKNCVGYLLKNGHLERLHERLGSTNKKLFSKSNLYLFKESNKEPENKDKNNAKRVKKEIFISDQQQYYIVVRFLHENGWLTDFSDEYLQKMHPFYTAARDFYRFGHQDLSHMDNASGYYAMCRPAIHPKHSSKIAISLAYARRDFSCGAMLFTDKFKGNLKFEGYLWFEGEYNIIIRDYYKVTHNSRCLRLKTTQNDDDNKHTEMSGTARGTRDNNLYSIVTHLKRLNINQKNPSLQKKRANDFLENAVDYYDPKDDRLLTNSNWPELQHFHGLLDPSSTKHKQYYNFDHGIY